MITVNILICTINKGVVRILDNLPEPREGVSYIVAYQYTDERYWELIPEQLTARKDVMLAKHKGVGLSANRNFALRLATADVVVFADDDARFSNEGLDVIQKTFEEHPELDVAFFQASTYTGRPLKDYPQKPYNYGDLPKEMQISALEKACRRTSIQGRLQYDERFGLGTKMFACGEEQIWLTDAERLGLQMKYFPIKIVETSTMLKQLMVYVDPCVQRAYGAISYYRYGGRARWMCLKYALRASRQGKAHFLSMLRYMYEGIHLIKKPNKQ